MKSDAGLSSRHVAVLANTAAITSLVPVALYQLGVVSHLPDPPSSIFASDQIVGSKSAHPLGVPDSLLGIASYSTTLTLLLASPRLGFFKRLALIKLWADGGFAAFNAVRQVLVFRKICSWCLFTVVSTGMMVVAGRQSLR